MGRQGLGRAPSAVPHLKRFVGRQKEQHLSFRLIELHMGELLQNCGGQGLKQRFVHELGIDPLQKQPPRPQPGLGQLQKLSGVQV